MQQHDILHALEGMVRERLAEHPSLPAMHHLINHVVRVVHALDGRECIVEIGLLQPFPMAVDVMEALCGVDGDEIGGYPDVWSVLFMERVEPEMPVTLEAVVELDPGCDGGKKWAGDVAEGVAEPIVEDVCDGLLSSVMHDTSHNEPWVLGNLPKHPIQD